jgi:NAD(P)-dependent dehydrogenase (short-subunit alcohol dehydrogenase family)
MEDSAPGNAMVWSLQSPIQFPSGRKAYIITGPTSGIGLATAFELAKHGTVVLVGRDRGKLSKVQAIQC